MLFKNRHKQGDTIECLRLLGEGGTIVLRPERKENQACSKMDVSGRNESKFKA